MNNECCGKNVTINVCGCCKGENTGSGITVKDTVLYDQIIDTVGTYQLADDVNNYDDIFIIHEHDTGNSRTCLYMPVRYITPLQKLNYGKGSVQDCIAFTINNDSIVVSEVVNKYRIAGIVGRKFV